MFDGDQSNAGRRERLMRKQDAKNAYTDKVGGDSKGGYRLSESSSNVPSSVFQRDSAAPTPMSGRPQPDSRRAESAQGLADDSSTNFSHRITAKRHAYEVEVSCQYPIVDMTSNPKRRTVTWFCAVDGVEDSYTVQIPQHFELETTQLLQDDMRNGKCKISVPAVTRSVFG